MIEKMEKRFEKVRLNENVIFGIRAVIEAINAEREINKILIQKGMDKDLFLELKAALKAKDFQLQFVPVQKLDALTQGNHQGVIAIVAPVKYAEIESFIDVKLFQF